MIDFLNVLAQDAAGPTPGGNPILMIGFMVVFIVFFYFVVIRPQSKQKKEMQNMLNNLKKGDKIVTIGGIVGKVASINDAQVTIRVNDANTEITFEKGAIAKVIDAKNSEKKSSDKEQVAEVKNDAKDEKVEDNNKL